MMSAMTIERQLGPAPINACPQKLTGVFREGGGDPAAAQGVHDDDGAGGVADEGNLRVRAVLVVAVNVLHEIGHLMLLGSVWLRLCSGLWMTPTPLGMAMLSFFVVTLLYGTDTLVEPGMALVMLPERVDR